MFSKKSFARLIRIASGTFGLGKDENFSQHDSFTRFEKFVHFWVLVWQSFVRNRCPVRASSLSYTTLLALIPMLVVAMSVSSWMLKSEGQERIEIFIQNFVENLVHAPPGTNTDETISQPGNNPAPPPDPPATNAFALNETTPTNSVSSITQTNAPIGSALDVLGKKRAASFIHEFIQNANSKTLGSVGMVFLLWTAIVMLTRIEDTFNDIWGVTRGRNWLSRVVLYWATITLGPILLITAVSLASGPRFQKTRDLVSVVPFAEPLMSQLLPVVLICFTFAMLYKLVPNTKVNFGAAFVGGAFAGISWYSFNILSLHYATSWVAASKIYGSLAVIPLLMVGLYTVWVIVLFGAQVAYAYQNRESYLQEQLADNVNQRGREFVALRLMTCISERFQRGLPPTSVLEMSRELGVPSKLVQQVLRTLIAARLVVEITGQDGGYTPARPIDSINCHHILLAMRATQGQELVTRDAPVRAEVLGEYARIQAVEKEAASSVTMLALVNRTQARLEILPPTSPADEIKPVAVLMETVETTEAPAPARTGKIEPTETAFVKIPQPAPPEKISPITPTAESTTDDNESFPL